MSKSHRSKKYRSGRRLTVERLETRRVLAGFVFDSVIYAAGGDLGAVYPSEMAVDSQGNSYMSGKFTGQVDFERTPSLPPNGSSTVTAIGDGDGFLAKYDSTNSLVWVRRFGDSSSASTSFDNVYGVQVYEDQSIYITGSFGGVADFGSYSVASAGGKDAFIAKLSVDGDFQWVRTFGTTNDDTGYELSVDGEGRVTILGETRNSSDIQLFVRQYSAEGDLNWVADDFATGNAYKAVGLEAASDGGLFLVAAFNGTVDADPTNGVAQVSGTDPGTFTKVNGLITKLSVSGDYQWSQAFIADDGSRASLQDTTVGADGSLVLVGRHTGSVTVSGPGSTNPSLPTNTTGRTFFTNIDALGNTVSFVSKDWATVGNAKVTSVGDNFFLMARFSGQLPVDDSVTLNSPGSLTSFALIELANDLSTLSASASLAEYFFTDVTSDSAGNILISSWIDGLSTDYDPSPNTQYVIANPATNTLAATQGTIVKLRPKLAGSEVTLLDGDFEYEITNETWTQDSQLDWFRSTQRSTLGGYSAEVDGSANNATLTTAKVIDLTGLESAQLTFDWLIESGFDSGEYLSLDISTNGGSSWIQDVRRLSGNVSAENLWHSEVVDLTPYMSADLKVRFRAKVSASDEDANVDNVRITGIVAGPNTSPIADAGSGYETSEGSSILLSAAASSDPDGSIVSYAWDFDNDGQYDDAVGMTVNFSTTASGPQTVGLQVMDNRGAIATTTTTVLVNNVAPTADAGGNLTGSIGQPINLSAAASSDPGQDIVSYQWDLDNDGFYNDADGISAVFTSAVAGAFTVGLKVTDADGAVDFDSLTITITSAPALSTKFYVIDDSATDRTFEYSADGIAVENYGLTTGNTSPRGAASTVAGDKVWVVDANKRVYVYDDSGVLLGSWTPGSLASTANVEGITTDGTDIWLVDNRRDRVYRYAGAASRLTGSQNAASSFVLNSSNLSPKDLVTDGNHIWVVNDNSTDRVFKYTMSGSLVGSWTIDSGNSKPTGITIDPSGASQSIWIVDNGTDRVYEYANARGRNSGSQSATVWFALAAGNGNPQGIADPPPVGSEARTQAPIIPTNGAMSSRVVNHQLDSHRLLSIGRSERAQDEQRETAPSLNAQGSQSQRFDQTHSESLVIDFSKLSGPQVDRPSHRMVDEVFADVDAFDGFDDFMLVIE